VLTRAYPISIVIPLRFEIFRVLNSHLRVSNREFYFKNDFREKNLASVRASQFIFSFFSKTIVCEKKKNYQTNCAVGA
jgi:hypothetical protein